MVATFGPRLLETGMGAKERPVLTMFSLAIRDDVQASRARPSTVVIGNFDGVHRGHVHVLGLAHARAQADGSELLVLTFTPHPSEVLGRGAPPLLTPDAFKRELLERAGVDGVVTRTFDLSFASWSPEMFARDLLSKALSATRVVIGENFRFGNKRAGDLSTLRALGATLGFETDVAEVMSDERGALSSTRARESVKTGDLEDVARVLGRPHALSGRVVAGQQLARTLGFPTANLADVLEVLPPNGVYAVTVERMQADRATPLANGVMNLGERPTVTGGAAARRAEVHLFDYAGDLYGAELRVHLRSMLRPEQKFNGIDALKTQIAKDADEAKRVLFALG